MTQLFCRVVPYGPHPTLLQFHASFVRENIGPWLSPWIRGRPPSLWETCAAWSTRNIFRVDFWMTYPLYICHTIHGTGILTYMKNHGTSTIHVGKYTIHGCGLVPGCQGPPGLHVWAPCNSPRHWIGVTFTSQHGFRKKESQQKMQGSEIFGMKKCRMFDRTCIKIRGNSWNKRPDALHV